MNKLKGFLYGLACAIAATAVAGTVYNYFPPPGMSYSPTTGLVVGSATGGAAGAGTINAQGLYVNNAPVVTGSGLPVGANPTAVVGLTAVNGSATTFMRSDAAPPLSQSIAPTMTGLWTFTPSSGASAAITLNSPTTTAINIRRNSAVGGYALDVFCGESSGVLCSYIGTQGTAKFVAAASAGDFTIRADAGNVNFSLAGSGALDYQFSQTGMTIGAPTGGTKGAGTLNATGLYVNGVAVGAGTPAGSTNQLQYNGGGVFAASSDFSVDATNGVLILDGTFGGVIGSHTGKNTQIDGGDAINDTTSAAIQVGSNGTSGAGGQVSISAGNGATSGGGGSIEMNSGNAVGSLMNGGTIQFNTGAGSGGGSAGNIVFDINAVTKLQITGTGGIEAGSPTGGDKGSGTINAQGLYINGTAVGTGSGTVTSVTCGTGLTGGTFTTSGTCAFSTPVSVANGGTGTASPGMLSGTGITVTGSFPTQTVALTTPVSIGNGGTGTASPGLVAGTNISITGSWPNQTITNTGSAPSNTSGTATLATGCTTTPALTYNAVQIGNHVTLTFQHYSCSASGSPTQITFSGVAGGLLPGNNVDVLVPFQNNGSAVLGECQVAGGGIQCHPLTGGTLSGTIGLGGTVNSSDIVLNYSLNNP